MHQSRIVDRWHSRKRDPNKPLANRSAHTLHLCLRLGPPRIRLGRHPGVWVARLRPRSAPARSRRGGFCRSGLAKPLDRRARRAASEDVRPLCDNGAGGHAFGLGNVCQRGAPAEASEDRGLVIGHALKQPVRPPGGDRLSGEDSHGTPCRRGERTRHPTFLARVGVIAYAASDPAGLARRSRTLHGPRGCRYLASHHPPPLVIVGKRRSLSTVMVAERTCCERANVHRHTPDCERAGQRTRGPHPRRCRDDRRTSCRRGVRRPDGTTGSGELASLQRRNVVGDRGSVVARAGCWGDPAAERRRLATRRLARGRDAVGYLAPEPRPAPRGMLGADAPPGQVSLPRRCGRR